MSEKRKEMEKLYNYFKKVNKFSPFPIIDSEILQRIDNKIKTNSFDYDDEPVVCCAHCKNLALITDDDDNDICPLCKNSLNETETHRTIFHYLNKYKGRWGNE